MFGSWFREDLIIARSSTLDEALHRANCYFEVEDEKAEMDRQLKSSKAKKRNYY